MPDTVLSEHLFLSVVRRGAAGAITGTPTAGRASIPVGLTFAETVEGAAPTERTLEVPVTLFGPEDVSGLDARVVCRTWPRSDVFDGEPNIFPLVEFSEPDLPWRYTPLALGDNHRLQPWLALVVLADDEFELRPSSGEGALPVLVPKAEAIFPRPDELWTWAHVHVLPGSQGEAQATPTAVGERLAGGSLRAVARLLAARRLRPRTSYTGFLVPTFERGRRAGLNVAVGTTPATTFAWRLTNELHPAPSDEASREPLQLPVYFQWRFGAGEEGDFRALAERLRARPLEEGVGRRAIDVSTPAPSVALHAGSDPFEVLTSPSEPVMLEAALRPLVGATAARWADLGTLAFQRWFATLTGRPAKGEADPTPSLAPPLYGAWLAGRHTIVAPISKSPAWFDDLNADPRTRVAAGMGTVVVQTLQDALMASAWEQAESIRAINETLRFMQVARGAAATIYARDLIPADDDTLFLLAAPSLPHILATDVTVRTVIERSPVPVGVFDAAWRRLARARGPMRARALRSGDPPRGDLLRRLNDGSLAAARPPGAPDGLVTPLSIMGQLAQGNRSLEATRQSLSGSATSQSFAGLLFAAGSALANRGDSSWLSPSWQALVDAAASGSSRDQSVTVLEILRDAPPAPNFVIRTPPALDTDLPDPLGVAPPAPPRTGTDNELAREVRGALGDLLRRLARVPPRAPRPTPLDLPTLRQTILTALDPEKTFREALSERLHLAPSVSRNVRDALEPILVHPEFPQPMYEPLRDRAQDWILPGLDKIASDTVVALQTNRRFIEAYMVGLNHEMGRELLWNEFPTDQRGTYFRQFWRARPQLPGETTLNPRDITAIDTWSQTALGAHGGQRDAFVLLIRSELLRRYPSAVAFAVRRGPPDEEHFPSFSGRLSPDVTFVGFAVDAATIARERDRWIFVIQEQPSEPRFGQDVRPREDRFGYLRVVTEGQVPAGDPADGQSRYFAAGTSSAAASQLLMSPTRVHLRATWLLRQMGM